MGTRTFRFEPKTTGGAYNPITFTAEITEPEKEYTISFDDTSIESKVFTESAIPIGGITLPAAEKTGYTFEGWYKENTFVNEISSPITAANLADIFGEGTSVTLYAKRTPITYNITYHNTDEAENSNPENYTIETETITLSAPQKTGYDFDGWYTDTGFSASATEIPQGSTGAKDFYAKWTAKTYTIIYNKDGGTIENESNYTSYTYGAGLTLPKPARDGFYFNGWYDNEQLSGDPVSAVLATDTENKTFWAKWTENEPTEYQIIFVDYNGTELKKGMVNVGEIPSCEEPAREQDDKYTYTFAGWTPEIEAVSANATYTATYNQIPRAYTVTYEKDGGTIEDEENYTSYTYGTALTLPTPSKAGFDFDGWYSDGEFNNKITEISSDATGDKTVYAKWNSVVNYKIIGVDKENNSVKLIKRTDDSAWLIVATYTGGGNLIKAAIKDISENKTGAEGADVTVANIFEEDYEKVKAFMWNNLKDMQPRCNAYPESE